MAATKAAFPLELATTSTSSDPSDGGINGKVPSTSDYDVKVAVGENNVSKRSSKDDNSVENVASNGVRVRVDDNSRLNEQSEETKPESTESNNGVENQPEPSIPIPASPPQQQQQQQQQQQHMQSLPIQPYYYPHPPYPYCYQHIPPHGYPPIQPAVPPNEYGGGHNYRDASNAADPTPDARRNRGGVTEPFPEKLHRMIEYAERKGSADVLSFFSHGRAFAIHKPRRFETEIMSKFFRQSKLTSFQRQLNLYGFRRISQGPDSGGYYHELFLKGRPGLCVNMKRTKIKGDMKMKRDPETEPNFYAMRAVSGNLHGGQTNQQAPAYYPPGYGYYPPPPCPYGFHNPPPPYTAAQQQAPAPLIAPQPQQQQTLTSTPANAPSASPQQPLPLPHAYPGYPYPGYYLYHHTWDHPPPPPPPPQYPLSPGQQPQQQMQQQSTPIPTTPNASTDAPQASAGTTTTTLTITETGDGEGDAPTTPCSLPPSTPGSDSPHVQVESQNSEGRKQEV